jgi:hypothetical protein
MATYIEYILADNSTLLIETTKQRYRIVTLEFAANNLTPPCRQSFRVSPVSLL